MDREKGKRGKQKMGDEMEEDEVEVKKEMEEKSRW